MLSTRSDQIINRTDSTPKFKRLNGQVNLAEYPNASRKPMLPPAMLTIVPKPTELVSSQYTSSQDCNYVSLQSPI